MSRQERRRRAVVLVTIGVWMVAPARAPGAEKTVIVPAQLSGVRGEQVDVSALAADQRLFFVTLKATWCPVCQEQLRRLHKLLPRLRSCGATFVVLAPGPRPALRQVADENGFPFPFVEDVDLALARSAGLRLADDQIEPAVFEVNASREIVWVERGRSAGRFNEDALLERLKCDGLQTAMSDQAAARIAPRSTEPSADRSIHASSRSSPAKPGNR